MHCILSFTGNQRPDSLIRSFEEDYEDTREDQFERSHSGDSKGMNKQKDFVKKNIEVCQSSDWAKWSTWIYRMT